MFTGVCKPLILLAYDRMQMKPGSDVGILACDPSFTGVAKPLKDKGKSPRGLVKLGTDVRLYIYIVIKKV